ncbi:MAG TPA: 16S rRNA (uracil(1498)-N(3))-methyltransferase [Jatrophihabitans sp.]|nr:16S rRNA (uracil(1498)-N(3))-methyltransferase [Jatrophihabitans sp.]
MSTPPLFLLDALPSGGELLLGGDEGRHAARVKRLRPGEPVLVSDGAGGLLDCRVTAVVPDGLRLAVLDRRQEPEPEPRLVVVQALPKGERAELAVETMTELGVDEIVPWTAARSVVQWRGARGEKALERWRRTAREAAKQSRRARVPVITGAASTAEVAERLKTAGLGLVLHEGAKLAFAAVALPGQPSPSDILLVVGPEGGIADDELAAFEAAGAAAVRLAAPVLRTSTAGAAALAALSLRLGRWG